MIPGRFGRYPDVEPVEVPAATRECFGNPATRSRPPATAAEFAEVQGPVTYLVEEIEAECRARRFVLDLGYSYAPAADRSTGWRIIVRSAGGSSFPPVEVLPRVTGAPRLVGALMNTLRALRALPPISDG